MREAFSIMMLVAAGLGASGCVSGAVLDHANKKVIRENLVYEVTAADRDATAAVILCVKGLPAERERGLPPVVYGARLPASLFGAGDAAVPALATAGRAIGEYWLPPEALLDDCPKETGDSTPLAVRHIPADRLGGMGPDAVADAALRSLVDEAEAGAALYVLEDADPAASAWLVYRHEAAVYGGSRLVRIRLPSETVKPNRNAVIILPVTLAVDTLLLAILAVGAAFSGY